MACKLQKHFQTLLRGPVMQNNYLDNTFTETWGYWKKVCITSVESAYFTDPLP